MIRFINLGNQIYPLSKPNEDHMFAWWNTVVDKFETYNQTQAWETWEEFVDDFCQDMGVFSENIDICKRYKSLFPDYWRKKGS